MNSQFHSCQVEFSRPVRAEGQRGRGAGGAFLATSHQPLATFPYPSTFNLQPSSFPSPLLKTTLALGLSVASYITLATPLQAMSVRVTPTKPKLGDTLSILIKPDQPTNGSNLSVKLNQKNYPAFAVAPNVFRALVPTTPLEKSGKRLVRVSSPDGQVRNLAVWVSDRKFPVQRIYLRPGKAGLEATQHELDSVAALKQLVTPQKMWNGAFVRPNRGRITTIYGVRRYYNGKFAKDYYHRGVDYAGAAGSPVVAPAGGRVALVGLESQGFRVHGNIVGIDHGQGVTSVFLHLSRINVKEGDFVKAGQVIGAVGSTGASTGPHLHWGLYVQGESVDPRPWNRGMN